MATLKTPPHIVRVQNIVNMEDHEEYTAVLPYSSVVNILLKMGSVMNEIPFVSTLDTVNQNDAFTGADKRLYLSTIKFLIARIMPLDQSLYYSFQQL